MGGIIPNKEDGITPGLLFAVTNPAGTSYNLSDPTTFGGLTERLNWRNQPNVVDMLKSTVKAMPEWQQSTADVFGGLRRGSPGSPLSLMLSMAELIVQKMTGTDINFDSFGQLGVVVTKWRTNLMKFLGDLDPLDPNFDPVAAAEDFIKMVFGDFSALLSVIPVGSLSSTAPNRLNNPTFTADALPAGSDWSVDTSTTRTADGSGSLHIVADGAAHAIRTGKGPADRIPVGAGQKIPFSGYARHLGAISGAGGPPVLLQIVPFIGDVEQPAVTVDTYTPAAADVEWPGHLMSGSYTVEPNVTSVQGRLEVTENAVQGGWWFDDFGLTQAADMNVIPGLPEALQTINSAWQGLMDNLASVARGFPVVGAGAADVVEAFKNFDPFNIGGSLGSTNAVGDFTSILQHMFFAAKNQPVDPTADISLSDVYNAINQALHNTAGQDVTIFKDTTSTVPIDPTWANQIDVIGVGRGQKGQDGFILNLDGQGGQAGKINATTWLKGTHYDNTLTAVTVTIATDGTVTIAIPGHSIVCAPGSGSQSTHFGTGFMGIGNQPYVYNTKPYSMGGNQNTAGKAGLSPGGGGAGGNGVLQPGGPGGAAGAWVRALSTVVTGGQTGADTTPPSGGTGSFVSATNTSITVQHSGAVDA